MNKIKYLLLFGLLGLIMVNCEQNEDVLNPLAKETPEQAKADNQRIEFLKSSKATSTDYENQQAFSIEYATQYNDSTFLFLLKYMAGTTYQRHEFDFIWDEQLKEDEAGKKWMNINVYHKTKEENPSEEVQDSSSIVIPEFLALDEEELKNLWIRFINTSTDGNKVELQYQKDVVVDNIAEDTENTQDSTGYSDSIVVPQDTTVYIDSTQSNDGYTEQDSSQYNTGNPPVVQDSTSTQSGVTTGGSTAQDSSTYSTNTNPNPVWQDSTQTGTVQGSVYTNTDDTNSNTSNYQDSTQNNGTNVPPQDSSNTGNN